MPLDSSIELSELLKARSKVKAAPPMHKTTSTQSLSMVLSNMSKDRLADSPGYIL